MNATQYSNSVEFSFPNLQVESCSIPVFLAESLQLEQGTFRCCLVSLCEFPWRLDSSLQLMTLGEESWRRVVQSLLGLYFRP